MRNTMTTYKFRSECLHDISKLLELLPLKIKIEKTSMFPDCIAEITSELSMAEIKQVMRKVPDSHVMIETIAPIAEYTGYRR